MLPLIKKSSSEPLYEQVYQFYKKEILMKQLKSGARLPSVRQLASDLGVSNNTIIKAYEQLLQEGYLRNEPRKGLFIEKLEKLHLHEVEVDRIQKQVAQRFKYNLSHAQVDQKNFPVKVWRKMSQLALDSLRCQIHFYEGEAGFKEQLSSYLYKSRGVKSNANQIVVCAGTNGVAAFLSILFRVTHRQLIFEEPGYNEVRNVFLKNGLKILPIPMTRQGIDLKRLPSSRNHLVYVIPSHQYPTGAVMPMQQRLQLIQWAAKTNSYIIEDDYDSEFRYKGKPIPSLQAIDHSDRVIYTGTLSKSLMPSLRVAYIVLPKSLEWREPSLEYLSLSVSYLTQKTLALFFEQGHWERHLRRMRKVYSRKYYHTVHCIKKNFGDKVSFQVSNAGLYLVLHVKSKLKEPALAKLAAAQSIRIVGAEECFAQEPKWKSSIFFGFGGLDQNEIESVIKTLKKVWSL
jgi:GntR family transcriptional regulator/MocR family aminotransferase